MAITTLTYAPPVRRSSSCPSLDYDLLEAAVTLADEGRPLESLLKVFEHLLPSEKVPNLATNAFSFTQGSSKVTTRIENDDVIITVPLVKLPTDGRAIAALRHILTAIAATGQLYQPRLRGDDVYLEFRDRLSRMHPAKVLEVLRAMPAEADNNDDFLIGQFGAAPLDRGAITPLDDAEFARAESIWRSHWNDVEELLKECQRKRSMFFMNEMTAYAYHRLMFALPVGGFVGWKLSESASTFNDSDNDPTKRETTLAKCTKDMKAVSTEDLRKSLGHASYAISPHVEGTPRTLSGYIGPGNYTTTIDQLRTTGKPFEAALALISTYNFLLSRFSWPEPIAVKLKAGLEEVSGKPWKETANMLLEHAKGVIAEFGSDDDDEEDDEDDDDEDDEDDGEDSDEDGEDE